MSCVFAYLLREIRRIRKILTVLSGFAFYAYAEKRRIRNFSKGKP